MLVARVLHALGWCGEKGLSPRPYIGETRGVTVGLEVLRTIPMAVGEEDPWVIHIVQQFQVRSTGKKRMRRCPALEELLEMGHMLQLEGHLHDTDDHAAAN